MHGPPHPRPGFTSPGASPLTFYPLPLPSSLSLFPSSSIPEGTPPPPRVSPATAIVQRQRDESSRVQAHSNRWAKMACLWAINTGEKLTVEINCDRHFAF